MNQLKPYSARCEWVRSFYRKGTSNFVSLFSFPLDHTNTAHLIVVF